MENQVVLRKKLIVVLKAAVLGLIIAEGLILLLVVEYKVQQYLPRFVNDFFVGLSFLLAVPSAMISSKLNYQGGLINEYLVNGILGTFIFAVAGAIWQFGFKGDHEK